MKKAITIFFVLTIMFSLCACGATQTAEPSVGDLMYQKYGSIINKLEDEEYEAAIEEITGMMPEPEKTVVTITADNFYDYYKLYYSDQKPEKDAQGNIVSIWGNQWFSFKLKDEFADKFVAEESQVEAGVTCYCAPRKIENIDWSTGEMTFSEEIYDDILSEFNQNLTPKIDPNFSGTFSGKATLTPGDYGALGTNPIYKARVDWGSYWNMGRIEANTDYTYYLLVPENIQIVRAEGTLTFQG